MPHRHGRNSKPLPKWLCGTRSAQKAASAKTGTVKGARAATASARAAAAGARAAHEKYSPVIAAAARTGAANLASAARATAAHARAAHEKYSPKIAAAAKAGAAKGVALARQGSAKALAAGQAGVAMAQEKIAAARAARCRSTVDDASVRSRV